MGLEQNKKDKEANENQEEENEEDHTPASPLSNLDLIMPPCEMETLMIKRAMVPQENNMLPPIGALISPIELEITAMKIKVACLEKTTTALKLELKCAEMQLEARNKVDVQKSKLLELLDAKVLSLEKTNTSLISMIEGAICDKQSRNNKMIEASNSMERLALKLEESDRMKRELKAHNTELKTMLNSVESKGTAIAKMAKEKLVKYRDENTRMQGELDDYKQKEEGSSGEVEWKTLSDLGVQVQDRLSAAKLSESPESTFQILSAIDVLNAEIFSMISQVKETTCLALQKHHDSNDKLLSHVQHLKKSISELQDLSQATLQDETPTSTQLSTLKQAIGSLMLLGDVSVEEVTVLA